MRRALTKLGLFALISVGSGCGSDVPLTPERYLGSDNLFDQVEANITANSDWGKVIEIDHRKGLDIRKFEQINTIGTFDIFVHLAAKTFVPESYENPREFYFTNLAAYPEYITLYKQVLDEYENTSVSPRYKSKLVKLSAIDDINITIKSLQAQRELLTTKH